MGRLEQLLTLMDAEPRVKARPWMGAWVGGTVGLLLFLYATNVDLEAVRQEGLVDSQLALMYLGGGVLSGVVGGLLWPYQRNRLETLFFFAIPTAVPIYVLAGYIMGYSGWLSLWLAVASGIVYSLLYGGEHGPRPPSRK